MSDSENTLGKSRMKILLIVLGLVLTPALTFAQGRVELDCTLIRPSYNIGVVEYPSDTARIQLQRSYLDRTYIVVIVESKALRTPHADVGFFIDPKEVRRTPNSGGLIVTYTHWQVNGMPNIFWTRHLPDKIVAIYEHSDYNYRWSGTCNSNR